MRERKPLRDVDLETAAQRRRNANAVWIKSDYFCQMCGARDVWQFSDAGDDYDHGWTVTCHTCEMDMCCVGEVED